ncbi:MAG: GNAT family N-acetyltransferase [Hyphomicrobium sp.]|nr:GNAT family N-acetyltransferase [Hyphomicrobium sp.]
MTTATFSHETMLPDASPKRRASWWRGPRFLVEVFDGADEALDALEAVQGGMTSNGALTSTGFQSLNWLTVLYEELAPAQRAMPRLVVVTERNSGEVAMILPLVIKKKRSLRVARFADLGVSDYGAPILGPALLSKSRSMRRAWRAVRQALRDVDLIRLENMPAEIAGRPNPLLSRAGIAPARNPGHVLHIAASVNEFIESRGEGFSTDFVHALKLLAKEGQSRFFRATTPEDIARAYSVLEEQQAARQPVRERKSNSTEPAFRQFYERVAMDGSDVEFGYLFQLEVGGEAIATLFGILHEGRFTVLRVGDAGETWNDIGPARLILIEMLRYFVDRGIRDFDLGRGEAALTASFGALEVPLFDLIVARDLAAVPRATFHRVKGRARKNQRLRAFARGLARLGGG